MEGEREERGRREGGEREGKREGEKERIEIMLYLTPVSVVFLACSNVIDKQVYETGSASSICSAHLDRNSCQRSSAAVALSFGSWWKQLGGGGEREGDSEARTKWREGEKVTVRGREEGNHKEGGREGGREGRREGGREGGSKRE